MLSANVISRSGFPQFLGWTVSGTDVFRNFYSREENTVGNRVISQSYCIALSMLGSLRRTAPNLHGYKDPKESAPAITSPSSHPILSQCQRCRTQLLSWAEDLTTQKAAPSVTGLFVRQAHSFPAFHSADNHCLV